MIDQVLASVLLFISLSVIILIDSLSALEYVLIQPRSVENKILLLSSAVQQFMQN